jgi:hypothetical protein
MQTRFAHDEVPTTRAHIYDEGRSEFDVAAAGDFDIARNSVHDVRAPRCLLYRDAGRRAGLKRFRTSSRVRVEHQRARCDNHPDLVSIVRLEPRSHRGGKSLERDALRKSLRRQVRPIWGERPLRAYGDQSAHQRPVQV